MGDYEKISEIARLGALDPSLHEHCSMMIQEILSPQDISPIEVFYGVFYGKVKAVMKHRRRSGKNISSAIKDIEEYFEKHNLKFRDLTEI